MELLQWTTFVSLVSVMLAFTSMCIAYRILRLNSRHSFKIHDFKTYFMDSVDEGMFYCLELKLQATGLPLQNPRVCISFIDNDKWGNCQSFMQRFDPVKNKKVEGEFIIERGAVATFAIKYGVGNQSKHQSVKDSFFYDIDDDAIKKCSIRIFHEDIVVAERKTVLFEKLMAKYNCYAATIEYRTSKVVKRKDDTPLLKSRIRLPKFKGLVSSPINSFAKMIREHDEKLFANRTNRKL